MRVGRQNDAILNGINFRVYKTLVVIDQFGPASGEPLRNCTN